MRLSLTGVVAIAGGRQSSAALSAQGSLWTWGGNRFGQLGTPGRAARDLPLALRGLGRVVGLAQGSEALHRLVLLAST